MPFPRFGPRLLPGDPSLSPEALFRFRAAAGPSLLPDTAHVPAFSRNTSATVHGFGEEVVVLPANVPAFGAVTLSTGERLASLRVEPASANLVAAGETFDTGEGWSHVGSVGVTPDARRFGHLTLARLNDTNTGSAAPVVYTVAAATFSGNGDKVLTCYVARGVAPSSAGHTIRLRDTSANVDRVRVLFAFTSDGETCNTLAQEGEVVSVERVGRGLFRIAARAPSCVAANVHQAQIYPVHVNSAASLTGDVLAGGVQLEDGPAPTSYIPRPTGADAGTRAADVLSWAWPDAVPPRGGITLAARFLLPAGDTEPATEATLLQVGDDDDRLALGVASTNDVARYDANPETVAATVARAGGADVVRSVTARFSDLELAPRGSVGNVNADAAASAVAAGRFSAWPDPSTIRVGTSTGVALPVHVLELSVLAGSLEYVDALRSY